jgi:methionine-rich copper-binding protein CopC
MPWRRVRSSVPGLVGTAVAALALTILAAPGATAHDYLVGSTPEQGATVPTSPSEVVLEFNTSIGQQFAQVAVVGPDGTPYQDGDPVVDGARVTQAVDGLPDGDITVSYRVVSSDGHPIGGTVPFTIATTAETGASDQGTGETSPASEVGTTGTDTSAETTDSTTAPASTASADTAVDPLVWLAAGALALALAVVATVLTRRRRSGAAVDA